MFSLSGSFWGCRMLHCGCRMLHCGCRMLHCGCRMLHCGCRMLHCGCRCWTCYIASNSPFGCFTVCMLTYAFPFFIADTRSVNFFPFSGPSRALATIFPDTATLFVVYRAADQCGYDRSILTRFPR